VGPIVTSALFYEPDPTRLARFRDRGHLAVEMEAAALFTVGAIRGVERAAMMTVSDLIGDDGTSRHISDEELRRGVDQMMRLACEVAEG
jgi:purine-nucleoside phosphorylase